MDARGAAKYEALLRAGRWFASLPEGFRRALIDAAVIRKLAKGEWLFARGDPPSGLFACVEGSVRITGHVAGGKDDGKEVLLAMVEPPLWFGELSVLDGQARTHDAIADDASVLVHVPQPALDAILEREPRYWRPLGVLVSAKLRVFFTVMEDAAHPLAIRLARRLVLSAERYGDWHDRSSRVVELRQDQLATMLATSRQTVNQLLKDLEARGVVRLAYGTIEIVDLDALRRAATPG
ncbi:Crp/Fnr family transcriptional regulator [Sandaracinus amylolyticus]|uniref:Transcriptional regulator, Crp/Fnr family protein n=1 Tax=Sandaracinus amylolyticus TaxID=927083 RepID=A0A0F6YGZ5_9BACT|nr:Crp/Fnr family transcriptional regulator [Sandaracinus amylolyticus]AKF04228.1 transcriptional regulator, Crp/Fnr family protein [Sandaracinus amylolyticus]